MIPYGRQNITQKDLDSVIQVLKSDFLTQGPRILDFEKALSEKMGSRYAVVFNSGTAALHAAYFALEVGQNDEVLTSPMTFAATSNAALYLGAKPVFCDIDPETGNMDLNTLEKCITPRTKVMTPVHYAGLPVDMMAISKFAKKHSLRVVEDACHAIGSSYQGHKTGNCAFSDAVIFSFHPVKHITTGEGGAVLTNDETLYRRMTAFRTHGISRENFEYEPDGPWYYEMQALGFNYRMTDIQAALGVSQLDQLDINIARRRHIAELYTTLFQGNPYFRVQAQYSEALSAYHLFPILLNSNLVSHKKALVQNLREKGIGSQVHYVPVPAHPYYRSLGYSPSDYPQAEAFYRSELSIPMFPELTDAQVQFIAKTILEICKNFA
jgi:UDP-4-amino-4,6-dideoxy-N-acetyl-beta-L-altrosamine transaminase